MGIDWQCAQREWAGLNNGSLRAASLVTCALALGMFAMCTPEPDAPDPNAKPSASQNHNPAPPPPPPNKSGSAKANNPPTPPVICNAPSDPAIEAVFEDKFDRNDLGPDWSPTGPAGSYVVRDNQMCTNQPKNHPIWLRKKLPNNVSIRFQATAMTAQGDIKVEFFGNGCSYDTSGGEYNSTGYVAVLGAHSNTEHWLARLAEHGPDHKIKADLLDKGLINESKVQANHAYQFEIRRRDGKTIEFIVDGSAIHEFEDPSPLNGVGHDHFGFDGWIPQVCFDNLVIQKLP